MLDLRALRGCRHGSGLIRDEEVLERCGGEARQRAVASHPEARDQVLLAPLGERKGPPGTRAMSTAAAQERHLQRPPRPGE